MFRSTHFASICNAVAWLTPTARVCSFSAGIHDIYALMLHKLKYNIPSCYGSPANATQMIKYCECKAQTIYVSYPAIFFLTYTSLMMSPIASVVQLLVTRHSLKCASISDVCSCGRLYSPLLMYGSSPWVQKYFVVGQQ